MSAWEFIAAVAWPVAVVVVAVLYRPLLVSLLNGGLRAVRAGPFELAWDQTRSATTARVRSEPLRAVSTGSVSSLTPESISGLVEADPRQAIIDMYEVLRQGLRRGLEEAGVDADADADALELCRIGERAGVLPPSVTDAVVGLNVLRNLAMHAPSDEHLQPQKAREYVAMAEAALYAASVALAKHVRSRPREAGRIPNAA